MLVCRKQSISPGSLFLSWTFQNQTKLNLNMQWSKEDYILVLVSEKFELTRARVRWNDTAFQKLPQSHFIAVYRKYMAWKYASTTRHEFCFVVRDDLHERLSLITEWCDKLRETLFFDRLILVQRTKTIFPWDWDKVNHLSVKTLLFWPNLWQEAGPLIASSHWKGGWRTGLHSPDRQQMPFLCRSVYLHRLQISFLVKQQPLIKTKTKLQHLVMRRATYHPMQ